MRIVFVCSVLLVLSGGVLAEAQEWPQFRGPTGQGHAEGKVPLKWDADSAVWERKIPGRGYSSPVVGGNRVWMTTAYATEAGAAEAKERMKSNTSGQKLTVPTRLKLHAVSVNRTTGRIEKNIKLFDLRDDPQWVHHLNSFASPTPVLAEGRLYCSFGSYGVACVDTASGRVLWRNQELGVMHENGPASSPVLAGGVLFCVFDGSDEQFVAGLDAATGKVRWKTKRSGELHENPQLKKAYGSPLMVGGTVVSPGANWVYGYDAATGEEKWKVAYGMLGFSNVARPVYGDGMLVVCSCYMKSQLIAYRWTAADEAAGRAPVEAWRYKKGVPAKTSPILVGEYVYFVDDKLGLVTCLDASSGEEVYRERLGGKFSSAPLHADGKIYWFDYDGVTSVVAAGPEFRVVAKNELPGGHMATAAVAGGQLFLRTTEALYCLGNSGDSD